MKKIRYGIVGLGHRGRFMGQIAATFECAEFVAACDILPGNWYQKQALADEPFCEKFPNTLFFEDYDRMLEQAELDVVIVETGADIHAEFCAKALKKNINVLTDIPVVANLEEAQLLWKAAQESKAMISVGANPNEQKFTVLLKEFYQKGLLGKPYCMEAEYIHWWLPDSFENIYLNENGDWRKLLSPIRYSTHSLGPLLTVVEEDFRYATCFGTGMHADNGYDDKDLRDDMQCAQFQTESGIVIRYMRNGRCRAKIGHHNYRVFGTEGYMERIDRFDNPVIRYNSTKELDGELKEINGTMMPPGYENNPAAHIGHDGIDYAILDHFFDAILKNEEAPISLKEGLRMTLPGIYAEESARVGGKIIKMKYPWDEDWSTEFEIVE